MKFVRGKKYWKNCSLLAVGDDEISTGKTTIYEVLRVIDFHPLFFHDHFERLMQSCKILNVDLQFNEQKLFKQIVELARINGFATGNIFVEQVGGDGKWASNVYFVPHQYPTTEMYEHGVTLGVLHGERDNPKVKVVQSELRLKANDLIKQGSYYEVLLVDENGIITEGSRSNVFFIKNKKLYTTPLEQVLSGITLKKVMEIAHEKQIEVMQVNFSLEEIFNADAVFLTGTSPKIIPVRSIDKKIINTSDIILRQLMIDLDLKIDENIKNAINKS